MVGYSEKHKSVGNFRVDHIFVLPDILNAAANPASQNFDINEYIKTSFRMFNSERRNVELICDNNTMDAIIGCFGVDVTTYANDMNTFRVEASIAVSNVFYSWVFGFGGRVKSRVPEDVKKEYADMVRYAYDMLIQDGGV